MIKLSIMDIDNKELSSDSIIQMVDEDTEQAYGDKSSIRLAITDEGTFEIRAFETTFSYKRIFSGTYAPLFKIVN